MNLVMFDIDGTLTRTYAVDGECFVQALAEVCGFAGMNDDWSVYPHCTDSGILDFIFHERKLRPPSLEETAAVQARFLELLGAASDAEAFRPVEGAEEMLRTLAATPGWAVSLASGAWECSARMKLSSAGLDTSRIPGAFADDAPAREDIMRLSLDHAAALHGRTCFDAVVYVGDGIWDARACRALGWPFIGIANDPAKIQRLRQEGAREVFPDHTDISALLQVLRREAGTMR